MAGVLILQERYTDAERFQSIAEEIAPAGSARYFALAHAPLQ